MSAKRRTTLAGGLVLGLFAPWLAASQGQVAPPSAAGGGPTEPSTESSAPAAPRSQPPAPQAFRAPEDGFAALAEAAREHDERRLLRVLGEGARRLIRSGDPVADRAMLDGFAAAYAERTEIEYPAPYVAVLQVGADGWPMPIPLIRQGNRWRFDARRGAQELVNRRIGRNELDTIEVLRAIVAAQAEYANTVGRQGAFRAYARRFFATPGTRDGLYWPATEGGQESPLGPLAAAASTGGYGVAASHGPQGDATPRPFHGYLFRILEAQGPDAPGGAMSYVVNGRMIGGFGVIAVPAQYGVSGIMTFQVSHAGIVYQRNLGPETARIARGITAFDPGPGWERAEE